MLTKAEALRVIHEAIPRPSFLTEVPLEEALGRVLARDAVSDIDMPAFERSAVDGWAVRSAEAAAPGARLKIAGSIMAGEVAVRSLRPGETMKIMTGAPLPDGADAVVMVEHSREEPGGREVVLSEGTRPGANVSHRAEDLHAGETVLRAGTVLDPAALALLATIGVDPVPTWRLPTVCVVPTGNELVEPHGPRPGPGRIRESNGTLLATQVRKVCPALRPVRPGIARDRKHAINSFLDVGLGHDVLILSGGVSMGDLDLVGVVLKERGLEVLIEKVAIKPGKPLLFGRLTHEGEVCYVFGLPGNPVSSFVTFELFVRPFLLGMLGLADPGPDEVTLRLGALGILKGGPRTQHLPAVLREGKDGLEAVPLEWHGSGDLRGIVGASGFVVIESGTQVIRPGELVKVHLLGAGSLLGRGQQSRGVAGA